MVAALTAACAPGQRPCRRRPPRPHPHPGWRAHVPIVQPGWAACCRASLASPSCHPGPTYGHGARPPWCSASPMPCRAPALMATPSRWPGLPGKGAGGENYGSEPLGMGQILHSPLLFLGALRSQQQAARGHVGVFPPLGLTSRPSGSLKGPLLPARLSIPAGHAGTQVLGALPVTQVSGAAPRDPGGVAWPGAGASVDTALWPCLGAMRVLSCSQLCSRRGAIFHKDAAPELVTTCTVDARDAPRQRQRVLARWGGGVPSHHIASQTLEGRVQPKETRSCSPKVVFV